jgi:outer membrane autotransporter protein
MLSRKSLKLAILCSTVFTSGAFADSAATPCVDSANGTQCSNGTSPSALLYFNQNPIYVSGDFVLGLDNYKADAGISLSGLTAGAATVTLQNGSVASGGAEAASGNAAIFVEDSVGNGATVNVLDTSSVVGSDNGIQVILFSADDTHVAAVNTGAGGVSGATGNGIDVNTFLSKIDIDAEGPVSGGVIGIAATTLTGNIEITTGAGAVEGQAGAGIEAKSLAGNIDVKTGTGAIVGGPGSGILANTEGSQLNIVTNGNVSGGYGIFATDASGVITVKSAGGVIEGTVSHGIRVEGGYSTVNLDIQSEVVGAAAGILVNSGTGDVIVETGTKSVTGGAYFGITVNSTGDIDINTKGNVTGTEGIVAGGSAGDSHVTTAAGTSIVGTKYAGIVTAGKNTLVDTNGKVFGVRSGIVAQAFDSAEVNTFDFVQGGEIGILATSIGFNISSGTTVRANGAVEGGTEGIWAASDLNDVLIEANAKVKGETSNGIVGRTEKGDISITAGLNSNVSGLGGDGISAVAGPNALDSTGEVEVSAFGSVHGSKNGINTSSDFGDIAINANGQVEGSSMNGISAETHGGSVKVVTGANSNIIGGSDGIYVFTNSAANFGGEINVAALGNVIGAYNGVSAKSSKDAVTVTTGSGYVTGDIYDGVFAESLLSSTINVNGLVEGRLDGVRSFAEAGNFIHNNGIIQNLNADASYSAIKTEYSATVLENGSAGKILGTVAMSGNGFDDSFLNHGLWQTSNTSYFGLGNDLLANSGTVRFGNRAAASEATVFSGLETFNNTGLLTAQDQVIGDVRFDTLELSGNFVGGAGSVLGLDAFLGGPGSLADVVTIGGDSSGSTALKINNVNGGDGAFNTSGILLVNVKGNAAASDFHLANGPINQGLFNYDLNFVAAAGNNQFLLTSHLGTGSNETVVAVDGVQNIWQGGADAWSGHQGELRDDMAGRVIIEAVADPVVPEDRAARNMWLAARGDWTQLESQSSFTYLNATNTFKVGYGQSTYGFDGGIDFGGDVGKGNVMFGIVAGYAASNVNFNNSANSIDLKGGSLGAYASYMSRGVFADLLVKHDWLGLDYHVQGTGNANTSGRSLGASADLGYRFGNSKMFMEPVVSFASTTTNIDQFVIGGGTVVPGTNTSTRIGAGARFGVNDAAFAASLTARVWNGIGDGNSVQVLGGGAPTTVNDPGFANGLSGEVSGNLSVNVSANAKLFAGGAVHFSKDAMNESVNGGLSFSW